MKKIVFMLLVLAQFSKLYAQTTIEEYNYITKGYQIQVESGLDMKKGYRLVDLHDNASETPSPTGPIKRQVFFKGLYREGEISPCAIMVVYRRLDNKYVDYICIPHWKTPKDIWDMYFVKVKTFTGEGAELMMWGLAKSAAFFAQNN